MRQGLYVGFAVMCSESRYESVIGRFERWRGVLEDIGEIPARTKKLFVLRQQSLSTSIIPAYLAPAGAGRLGLGSSVNMREM